MPKPPLWSDDYLQPDGPAHARLIGRVEVAVRHLLDHKPEAALMVLSYLSDRQPTKAEIDDHLDQFLASRETPEEAAE